MTLAALLTLAMLLGSIVFIAFWQKGLVRTEIEHARSVWETALSTKGSSKIDGALQNPDYLKTLCGYTGQRCVGIILSGGEHWLKNDMPEMQEKSLKLAQESAMLQTELLRLQGNPWDFLSSEKRYILIAEPFISGAVNKKQSAVIVIVLDSIYESILKNHKAIFVYLLVNVILLTVIGFFRLVAVTVKPIERMVRMSESYQDSDVLFFDSEKKRSELGQLSMALNNMFHQIESDREELRKSVTSLEIANTKLLKTQKEMIRTEKIASVGRLSAGLAHEIGNPLGIAQGYIELLQQPDLGQAEKTEFALRAQNELDRVNKLIRQLLDYAGSSSPKMSVVNLGQLFEGICQIAILNKHIPPITLLRDIPEDILIESDGESLRQVFLNCLLNALDAIEAKKGDFKRQVKITAEKVIDDEGQSAEVHIRMVDEGIGIEEKDLQVIFDPFFTTKDPGKGTGLGLFVSHSIIDAHGGKIWIESTYGKGSTVHIKIPLYTAAAQGERDEASDHRR